MLSIGARERLNLERVRHHDLVIIGTGSGNSILDARFERLDVAIVEGGTFGGTCLNVGCIPTKMFVLPRRPAPSAARTAARLGVDARVDGCDWPTSATGSSAGSTRSRPAAREYRAHRCRNITLYDGHAPVHRPERRLTVGDRRRRSPPTGS